MGNQPWISGWWFGTWILFFHSVGNNNHNWLSYFSEGLKPPPVYVYIYMYIILCTYWWCMMIYDDLWCFFGEYIFSIIRLCSILWWLLIYWLWTQPNKLFLGDDARKRIYFHGWFFIAIFLTVVSRFSSSLSLAFSWSQQQQHLVVWCPTASVYE